MNQQELRDRIEKVEALFAGTRYDGERQAAGLALARLRALLEEEKSKDPMVEHKFTQLNQFSRKLMIALLRRYGLKPYRYRGQRYTTVHVKGPDRFIDDVLWPEFLKLEEILTDHLNQVADQIIAEHIHESAEPESEVAQIAAG